MDITLSHFNGGLASLIVSPRGGRAFLATKDVHRSVLSIGSPFSSSWPIASFRCGTEFGRYRGIADIGQACTDQTRFMRTRLVHLDHDFSEHVSGHQRTHSIGDLI